MDLITFIRQEIRNIILEDFKFQHKNDKGTFIPTGDVIGTARRALEAVGKNKMVKSDGSNEGSGLQKAQTLADAEPMTHQQLKRMKAFFDKNIDKVEQAIRAGETFENSEMLQKWDLWGGDAGKKWVESKLGSVHDSNVTSKKVRADTKWEKLMQPYNTRTHDVNSLYTNQMNEASIGQNGELTDFSVNPFIDLVNKYVRGMGSIVKIENSDKYEYKFPEEAQSELFDIGVKSNHQTIRRVKVTNPRNMDYGKTIIYVTANPNDFEQIEMDKEEQHRYVTDIIKKYWVRNPGNNYSNKRNHYNGTATYSLPIETKDLFNRIGYKYYEIEYANQKDDPDYGKHYVTITWDNNIE